MTGITSVNWADRVLLEDLVEVGSLNGQTYRLTIKAGTKVLTSYVNHQIVTWNDGFKFAVNMELSQEATIEQFVGTDWVEVARFTKM